MPSVKVYKMDGTEAGEIELSEKVFGVDYNEPLIHQAVVTRLANERQGTKSALTRSEVRGGGIKPWKQKGTGRARQGSIRAPQWVKGGIVFAPKPRDFSKRMNKKARIGAMLSALSKKVADGELIVVDKLEVENGKTKEMVAFAKALGLNKSAIIYMDSVDDKVMLACRNIPKINTLPIEQISTYELVANAKVVLTTADVQKLEEAYGK
ncbi:MAG: 50S ribosomal protein L4 [Clostridia bacterium]|nr:50S ribosomal protein L4 [Clostridia bacterium]